MSLSKILKESTVGRRLWGTPKEKKTVSYNTTAVLGVVEQMVGQYVVPSFRSQVETVWNDPVLREGLNMFCMQMVSTKGYNTANPKYTTKINGMTALETINSWDDANDINLKIPDIAFELRAYGNSVYQLDSNYGFIKVPIEALWKGEKVADNIPLQVKYNIRLTALYNEKILEWGKFHHFRVNTSGYHAPWGMGIVYGLLARPIDKFGRECSSIYDTRLAMRYNQLEGYSKFSSGNEIWSFEGMSNEDFLRPDQGGKTIGERVADMSPVGNRIVTNAKGSIQIAVPERAQSYDKIIDQFNNEFFMGVGDPSLKLGLELGFTKATAETAASMYKYPVASMRKVIKNTLEDIYKGILDNEGFDGEEAAVRKNFGPEENPTYEIADVIALVKNRIIKPNEARKILSEYRKFDISGDIEGGDEVQEEPIPTAFGNSANNNKVSKNKSKEKEQ
jgi:hypothetical protein